MGNPILVYQMGKVGSTSVLSALDAQLPDRRPVHLHTLSAGGLAQTDALYRERFAETKRIDGVYLRSRWVASLLPLMRRRRFDNELRAVFGAG